MDELQGWCERKRAKGIKNPLQKRELRSYPRVSNSISWIFPTFVTFSGRNKNDSSNNNNNNLTNNSKDASMFQERVKFSANAMVEREAQELSPHGLNDFMAEFDVSKFQSCWWGLLPKHTNH